MIKPFNLVLSSSVRFFVCPSLKRPLPTTFKARLEPEGMRLPAMPIEASGDDDERFVDESLQLSKEALLYQTRSASIPTF